MKVGRRAFVRSSMAIAAAVSLPACEAQARQEPWYVDQLRTTGRLENCTVVLDEPFIFDDTLRYAVITNVTFVPSDTFPDHEPLVKVQNTIAHLWVNTTVHYCRPKLRSVCIETVRWY